MAEWANWTEEKQCNAEKALLYNSQKKFASENIEGILKENSTPHD